MTRLQVRRVPSSRMKALRLVWMARPGAHGLNAVLIAKTPVDDDDFLVAVTHVLLIRGVGHPGVVLGHAPRRGCPLDYGKKYAIHVPLADQIGWSYCQSLNQSL